MHVRFFSPLSSIAGIFAFVVDPYSLRSALRLDEMMHMDPSYETVIEILRTS
jgi:hypothetical protein